MEWKFKRDDLRSGDYRIASNTPKRWSKHGHYRPNTLWFKSEVIFNGNVPDCKNYAEEHIKKN